MTRPTRWHGWNERKAKTLALFRQFGILTVPEFARIARISWNGYCGCYKYLDHLTRWGLLKKAQDGRVTYRITQKGLDRLRWLNAGHNLGRRGA